MSNSNTSHSMQQTVDESITPSNNHQHPRNPTESTLSLTQLFHVSSYLVSVLDPDELLKNLVSRVIEALPAIQCGMLWLYERRSSKLRIASEHGFPLAPATLADLKRCQINPGEGVAGQTFLGTDTKLTQTQTGYRDTAERLSAHNQQLFQQISEELPRILMDICIPLRVKNETIGVLELIDLGDPTRDSTWSPLCANDVQMLQTFGNLAAAAIKNAQLYAQTQSHRRRLDAFDAVVTAISTATDLDDLIISVLDVVLGLVPVSAGALILLDPAESRLVLSAQRGLPAAYANNLRSFSITGSAYEEVVRYGQPTLRPLIEERGETVLLEAGLASCVYLPLLAGGTVVGVLGLYGHSDLPQWADVSTLMPLSNQVGFAVANVQLYQDSQVERRKLNTVINSIAEGVVLCDNQGRLMLANEAAMELLSLDYVPFQQPLSEMPDFYGIRDLDNQPLPVEKLPLARALSGEVFHDYHVLLRGVSGADSVMSFSGAPTRSDNSDIEGAVVVFRDITAKKKLERAKDEFLAIAAHELRSPLAAVRSYADLLLRREQQRSEVDPRDIHGLTILSQQVTHMLRMVDNLLDVSRIDAGQLGLQLQYVNLIPLVTQVLDQQRLVDAKHELVLNTDQAELWAQCDPLRIRQVLTNLVGNAIKYSSPPDTRVTVYLTIRHIDGDTQIREHDALHALSVVNSSQEALISVTDMGGGIPLEQQANLFQRYYRAGTRRAEGLGLGLYLSRQFVLMHGGNIWVDSIEGKGSTFSFTLPMDR